MEIPWRRIENREQLVSVGPSTLRSYAVDIIEHAIRAADPYCATKNLIKLEGNNLFLGDRNFEIEGANIYVVGGGKASQPIALALEEIFGDRISEGVIALKQGEKSLLSRIATIEASHPVPDKNSFLAAKKIFEISEKATEKDVVIAIVTGGSSSLVVYPAKGLCLEELQDVNRLLLSCGASIREINAVRKHLSQIKGGRLAAKVFPATLINLTVSDVIGDPLDYITDLTVVDTSSWEDAWNTMDKYRLWEQVPIRVKEFMLERRGGETPKEFLYNIHSCILVPGDAAHRGAVQRCKELGITADVPGYHIEGESCTRANDFVALADNNSNKYPSGTIYALIGAGETTVKLNNEHGDGGPNQEFSLYAALSIEGRQGIVVAAVGTDGTDGPTGASGGLVDGFTIERSRLEGLRPEDILHTHNSMRSLKKSGDLVITGPTGTNVNDLMIVLVDKR